MSDETARPGSDVPAGGQSRPPHLRLVWSNPNPVARPSRPLDLAVAIERHLRGEDGLSDEDFLRLFTRPSRNRPA